MALIDDLLKGVHVTPEDYEREKANSGGERRFGPRKGVEHSEELNRILALPRRHWEDTAKGYVEKVSAYLRAPGGTQMLRPVQAASLVEAHDYNGLFGPQRVGAGKTLVSLLAFTVLGAKRPLLLIPAKLKDKTLRDMHALRKHWLVPGWVRVITYELLGREQSSKLLEEWNPDVIVMDEAHRVKNRSAAVTRRVDRYLDEHPDTRVIALSGTFTKRSIKDYAHIAKWCLKDLNPTPRDFNTIMEWGMALDEQRGDENRLAPGALIELCGPEERATYATEPVRSVRKAFGKRLIETPGVIATQDDPLGASLSIDALAFYDPAIEAAAAHMRSTWQRPDGEPMLDGIELWRHLREIACGFFYRWNPAPPQQWVQARRTWAKFVREVLRHNRRGIDSESQVVRAVDAGHYDSYQLAEWRAVKDLFVPQTEAVWVTRRVLERVGEWMRAERGIAWVEHTEFGLELARSSGMPFYWRGGKNAKGVMIEDHPPGEPLIASIASNAEGRNLQAWNTNLIVSCPPTGAIVEQLLGRTHRDGQLADEVSATIAAVVPEQLDAFDRARSDALMIGDTMRQNQKLFYADMLIPERGPERDALFAHAKAHFHEKPKK